MKTVRIILLLPGLLICLLAVKALSGAGDIDAALRDAVVLEAPVLLEENEGKLVVVYGVPEMTAPAYDGELGLTLETVKALRYKESYERTDAEEGKSTWKWTSKGMKTLFGKARLGEFRLDEALLNGLPVESDYAQFDGQEALRYHLDRHSLGQSPVYVMEKGAYYYPEETLNRRDDGLIDKHAYSVTAQREGTAAYRYRHFDADRYEQMTFVGRQTGGVLTVSGVDGLMSVHTGVLSAEKLASANRRYLTLGACASVIFGAVLMLPAVWGMLRKIGQKRRAE